MHLLKLCSNILLAVLLPSLGFVVSANADSHQLLLGADVWCPYNCDSDNHDNPGYIVEIAREIFAPHGISVVYSNLPWSRAKAKVSDGEIDGIIGASITDSATKHLVFPKLSQGRVRNTFFTLDNSVWRYEDLRSLFTVRLGAIQDYDYGEPLQSYIFEHAEKGQVRILAGEQPLQRLLYMLEARRIDVLLEDLAAFEHKARQLNLSNYRVAGEMPADSEANLLFIAFSPTEQGQRYANILDDGLVQLRKSGRLGKILGRYDLVDWQ